VMSRWTTRALLTVVIAIPSAARAQEAPAPVPGTPPQLELQAPQTPQGQPVPLPSEPKEIGEGPRGFLSALGHNLVSDLSHVPRMNSVYWLAAGAAGALIVHPGDDEINGRLRGSDFASGVFKPGHVLGSTYFILGGAVTSYMLGREMDKPRLQHLGMDLIEATILAEGFSQGLKLAVRRDRPVAFDGTQSGTYSFPSGHSTLTFAAASVLQQHLGYKAGIPTYLVASYVAMSRLHDNRHFASDVVFGASLGVMIGRSVTWHGRNFYATPMLVPGGAGIMLARID
jgi:hypothetical protein